MPNNIFPCLWFDGKAKEAANFYCSIFKNSRITLNTPMVVKFDIEGFSVMGLNGGPMFTINPSISLFVNCENDTEIEFLFNKLSANGKVMMPLNKYPWSEKYAWVADQFGMTWQLMLGNFENNSQKILPNLLFVGNQFGKANKAIEKYTSIFSDSIIHSLQFYVEGEPQPAGSLKFGSFSILGKQFSAMDGIGGHEFAFNEAVSFSVECDTQEEIDYYWKTLTEDGGNESMCGWLKDMFGISWQIVPAQLGSLMSHPLKGQKAMQALMKMKKIDIAMLENA